MSIWRNRLFTHSLPSKRPPTRARPQLLRLEDRVTPTVNVTGTIIGIKEGDLGADLVPPVTMGAVGPTVYVEEVNSSVAIFNRSGGAPLSIMDMGTFFG